MIEIENIDELLSKFFSGEASPEEAMLLEDWKNDHPDHLLYYVNSEKMFALIHNEIPAAEPDASLAWEKIKDKIKPPAKVIPLNRKPMYGWLAAACITLLIGIGILFMFILNPAKQQEIVYNTGKESKEIKLSDGTDITIAPNSNLVVDKDFGKKNRTLHLKGDASFSVTHQEELPFVVDAGDVFIKDIGTKFTIKSSADTDTVYIAVDEGVVLLFDSLGSSLEIKASGKALYIRSIRKIVTDVAAKKMSTSVQFAHSSLNDVVMKLNTLYNTTIVLENDNLKNCIITTQFNQEDLETVLGIITETLGLSYEKTPTGYLIKGQSCQPQ